MRILFLNQTFHPDVAATAQYASDLAASLAGRGHDVNVICSRRAYDTPERKYPARDEWRGVNIRRISSFGFGKTARWRRAADFGSFIANCARHLSAQRRFDVVVGMTSPPLISWIGSWFARLRGGRFVFWVMDLNPDEAVAAGWLREGSYITRVLQAVLQSSLHHSSKVVVLDRFMATRIADKGVPADRIVTIAPWSLDDAVEYDAAGRDRFRRAHGLEGKFVVMYSGNHSPCHPLTTLLEAARALRSRSEIAFCFAGGGSEVDTVRRFAVRHKLRSVVVVPHQPLSGLSASLSAADLHVVVMGDPFVGIVHPCKAYNIRRLGIPYLYVGPAASHVSELSPDYSARHGDVDAVVRHIQCAADSSVGSIAQAPNSAFTRSRLLGEMATLLEDIAVVAPGRQVVGTARSRQI